MDGMITPARTDGIVGSKQLLREYFTLDYKPQLLKEDRSRNDGKLMLSGVIQRANTKNQNERVYPVDILRREIENYQKAVRESRAVGELDHPESSVVSLERVSHIIREIWWDGDNVMGRIEVLESLPKGEILAKLLESGVTIGISSRGVGSTEKRGGTDIVQPDFQIICFDIVSEPSTPGAYLFREARDYDAKKVFTKADRIFRALNDIVMR